MTDDVILNTPLVQQTMDIDDDDPDDDDDQALLDDAMDVVDVPEGETAEPQAAAKKGVDPRHLRRIQVMQHLFAYSFYKDDALKETLVTEHPELSDLITQIPQIDEEIQVYAPERPLSDINKVDLAILRSIVFEWKTSQVPQKVLINEGIELAKEFGTESSPRFVNGVLAKMLQKTAE